MRGYLVARLLLMENVDGEHIQLVTGIRYGIGDPDRDLSVIAPARRRPSYCCLPFDTPLLEGLKNNFLTTLPKILSAGGM